MMSAQVRQLLFTRNYRLYNITHCMTVLPMCAVGLFLTLPLKSAQGPFRLYADDV
jgi:hypothetical protein